MKQETGTISPTTRKPSSPRGALFHNIHELFIGTKNDDDEGEEWKGKGKPKFLVRFQGTDDFGIKIGLVAPWTAITLFSEGDEDRDVIARITAKIQENGENFDVQ